MAFEITSTESFAEGQDFGAGPYLRIAGIARGELDPANPATPSSPTSPWRHAMPPGGWSMRPRW
ncbi:hypothetical protein ACFQU2_00360 [Siccirubricoccus deserti]